MGLNKVTKVNASWRAPKVPADLSFAEFAWRYLALRVLQAVIMMHHPAYKIIESHAIRRASTTSATRMTTLAAPTPKAKAQQKALSSMSKQELIDEAESLGFDVRGARITHLRLVLQKHRRNALLQRPPELRGLSSMRRAELVDLAEARHIARPETMTVEQLRAALGGWCLATANATGRIMTGYLTPSANDHITFGKHKGLTYEQLFQHYPKYVAWVLDQTERNTCSADLSRLGTYLRMRTCDDEAMQPYTPDPNDSPEEEAPVPPPGWTVEEYLINSSEEEIEEVAEEVAQDYVPGQSASSGPARPNKMRTGQDSAPSAGGSA
jgi:hypothetical protein